MNTSKLIVVTASNVGVPTSTAEKVIKGALEVIGDALAGNEKVVLHGLATLDTSAYVKEGGLVVRLCATSGDGLRRKIKHKRQSL